MFFGRDRLRAKEGVTCIRESNHHTVGPLYLPEHRARARAPDRDSRVSRKYYCKCMPRKTQEPLRKKPKYTSAALSFKPRLVVGSAARVV